MAGLFTTIHQELDNCFYYDLARLCGVLHCPNPPLQLFISALHKLGYKTSLTHCCKGAFKTDAPSDTIYKILSRWCFDNNITAQKYSSSSPAFVILSKPNDLALDFFKDLAVSKSKKSVFTWFQEMPANWGPKAKAVVKKQDKVANIQDRNEEEPCGKKRRI